MKAGVYYELRNGVDDLRNPPQWFQPWPQYYARALEHVQAMDELGMHSINFSEHHFDRDGYCPSVIVWCAAAAVRTKRAKIGQNIVLLPFVNPVRLAEDIATIDILSNGRAWVEVGMGHRAVEFDAFGVPRKDRAGMTAEGVEILRKCFTEEEFSYTGKFYNLQNVRMRPKPVQKPHPPIFVATTVRMDRVVTKPMERIIQGGFNVNTALGGGVGAPPDVDTWEQWHATWADVVRRYGKDPSHFESTMLLALWVTDDPEREWRKHREGIMASSNAKGTQSGFGNPPRWSTPEEMTNWKQFFQTPNDAAKYLRRMFGKAPLTHLLLEATYPCFTWAESLEYMRLFQDKVVPQIQDLP